MQPIRSFLLAAATALALAAPVRADEVTHWNNVWLNTIRLVGGPPCPIGRAGGMIQGAIYDAVNSIDRTRRPYLGFLAANARSSKEAAIAAAAHGVLVHLFPAQQAIFDAELATRLALIANGSAKTLGIAVGEAAAAQMISARKDDGSDLPDNYVIGGNPGDWRPTYPDFTPRPFSPRWGDTVPFCMKRGDDFRRHPLGFRNVGALLRSQGYADHFDDVKSLGSRHSTTRTAEQTRIAFFWANDVNGTYKPPGHLFYITQVISADHRLSLEANARLFALVGLAMADAGVAAWDTKYKTAIDLWRPITAIREAGSDGNPSTQPDPNWEPLNSFSPPFPAYTSGHATFGAAQAGVLAEFFGTDRITFTIDSEDPFYNALPIHGPRTFHRLSDAAIENGLSRIYLGVHFRFDATDGNAAGFALGHDVGKRFLRPREPADFDGDGRVGPPDLFGFISAYFATDPRADFNRDGFVTRGDLFGFLLAYSSSS